MRARYGETPAPNGTQFGRSLLLARRLVEAGVSVVTQCFSGWDTHRENFLSLRGMLPRLDRALHALVTDLDERGMLEDFVSARADRRQQACQQLTWVLLTSAEFRFNH